jgi:DUF4097 and DUF4098 domain-containing protein YvlB
MAAEINVGLLTLATAVLAGAAACVDISGADFPQYVEREEKQFAVTGKPEATLTTFDGSIQIRPWDRSEVQVVVEKRALDKDAVDTITVDARQDGNRIVIDVKAPKHEGFLHSHHRSAKLIVSMPATADVIAKSGDGSIDVEGITGQLELRSGDGSIRGRRLNGDVFVHTGDGSIRLEAVKGALRANTGDGSIVAEGEFTNLSARSGDGSVRISAESGSASSGDWDITTGDGSVTLSLPDGFNAEIDAHTGDGRVHLRDLSLTNVTGRLGRHSVRGRLGAGGSTVRVRTGDGSITLRRSSSEFATTLPAERP